METISAGLLHRPARQAGHAAFAVALAVGVVLEVTRHSASWWPVAAFGLGPDLALFAGIARGLRRGQLHPRAVPLYNLVHRFAAPLVLVAVAAVGLLGVPWLVGGLAWTFHVALDRTVGYGLRGRDGFQRA